MKKLVGSVVLPILGLSLLAGCAPTGGTAAVVNGVSIPDSRVTEATDGCASVMRDLGVPEGQMHLQVLRWAVFDEVARQFVAASGVDSVTQYELWKAIWSSIKDRNMFELDWSLTRHNGFLAHFTPQTFIGNHDVTRIASALGPDGALAAAAILLTVGGIPSIYYGDEQGFVGIKEQRLGGDDDVRPAFPNAPWELADWGRDIYRAHQELVALRRRNPWLVTATTTALQIENSRYCYRAQAADGRAFMDVNVDLTVTPSVTIKNADGQVLWAQRRH